MQFDLLFHEQMSDCAHKVWDTFEKRNRWSFSLIELPNFQWNMMWDISFFLPGEIKTNEKAD